MSPSPDGLLTNSLILFLQAPRWEKEPSSLRFRMLCTSWRISPLSRLFISGAPMSLSVDLLVNWLMTCTEDVIAIQETHLRGAALRDFVRKITAAGFRVYEGESLPTVGRHKGDLLYYVGNIYPQGCPHFPFGRMWICGGRYAHGLRQPPTDHFVSPECDPCQSFPTPTYFRSCCLCWSAG